MNTDKHRYLMGKILAGVLLSALCCAVPTRPQSPAPDGAGQSGEPGGNGASLPKVIEAIEKARVVTRILYVTAHPDDEPGSVLSYLARGLHADVALLSLTRGEGGQNALGPEQAPQLGIIRTEELSRATQVYGTRLFFTRAADFGYTKSPEEAMKVWGDQVLDDMVRVIRTFRPHVIINNWGGVRGGHGHHVAAGLLTPKAYAMAADENAFPEEMKEGLKPWKSEALLQLARGEQASSGLAIPVNEVSALWGKSWAEIGIEGWLNHRTQGIGGARNSPFLRRAIALVAVDGAKPDARLLGAPLSALAERFPNLRDLLRRRLSNAEDNLAEALQSAQRLDWRLCGQKLLKARGLVAELIVETGDRAATNSHAAMAELDFVLERIDSAVVRAAGLRVEAAADRADLVAGESFVVSVNWQRRGNVPVEVEKVDLALPEGWKITKLEDQPAGGARLTVAIPRDLKMNADRSTICPWPGALVKAKLKVKIEGDEFETETEVTATRVTSVSAETRPLLLVPAVTLAVEPRQMAVVGHNSPSEREIVVRVRHYATSAEKITVEMEVPRAWYTRPPQTVTFNGAGDELVRFGVKPPAVVAGGKPKASYELRAYARRADGEEFRTSLEPLVTMPTRLWSEPAVTKVHVMDVSVPQGLRVGYVAAENDPIPEALREIGIRVELLDEAALSFGDLSQYDAICVGIRAYELRQDLPRANQRLLDYAAAGGTLVVQYQRENVWGQLKLGPYPASVGAPPRVLEELAGARTTQQNLLGRVTDENSPVRFVDPKHPVLNFPNAIGPRDFEGWVQERGLYFFGQWDARYTPVLALRDPGEEETLGGLVYARTGKGVYIYTGLSFFRQLPEGVAGAYRLFVNLLSQGKRKLSD